MNHMYGAAQDGLRTYNQYSLARTPDTTAVKAAIAKGDTAAIQLETAKLQELNIELQAARSVAELILKIIQPIN